MAHFVGPVNDGTYVYHDSHSSPSSNNLVVNTLNPAELSISRINTTEAPNVKFFETNFGGENSCGNYNFQGIDPNFNLRNGASHNSCVGEPYDISSNMTSYDCDMFSMHYCCPDSNSNTDFHSEGASGATILNENFSEATCSKSLAPSCSTDNIVYTFVNDSVKVEKDSKLKINQITQRKTANRKAALLSRRRKSTQTDETLLLLENLRKENEVLCDQVQNLQYEAFKIHTIMSNCANSKVSLCDEVELPSISLDAQSDDYIKSPFEFSE